MRSRWPGRLLALLFSTGWLFTASQAVDGTTPGSQKEKKKDSSGDPKRLPPEVEQSLRSPDDQVIDKAISEMLAAWQIGDTQMLHKYYADDVIVVSGTWQPPLIGWAKYLQAYEAQRRRVLSPQLNRMNTYITVKGNFAWAVYQWDFGAFVDGKAASARGHTTLILEKRNDRWLIVYNHTSLVSEAQQQPAPSPPPGENKPAPPGSPRS